MWGWISRLRRGPSEQEFAEEIHSHLAHASDENMERGMAPQEARYTALRTFGNVTRHRERFREASPGFWFNTLWRDVRYAVRSLRKSAIVSSAAIVSLALAIGACVAAFALIDALMLRPLPVHQPTELVYVTYLDETFTDDVGGRVERDTFSYPLFERLREAARPQQASLFAVGYQSTRRVVFVDAGASEEKIRIQLISGDAFSVLGVQPAVGRPLTASDDVDGHRVAVLSHSFWMRRFGGDESIVGRSFTQDDQTFEIVGVLERRFFGVEPGVLIDVWVPATTQSASVLTSPGHQWLRVFGRLRSGVLPAPTQTIMQATFTNFRRDRARLVFRSDEPRERVEGYITSTLNLRPGANGLSGLRRTLERPLWILAAIVGLVLLIAGSNVANLLLARGAAREHEMSVRLSIGAGRGRLIQQVLIESAVVAVVACVFGLLFASGTAPKVVGMLAPEDSPAYLDLQISWRVLAFLGLLGLLTSIVFGLAPALRASGVAPISALKAAGGRAVSRAPLLRPLVALQAGFSVTVLFVGALLLLSFGKLTNIDLGFDKSGVLLLDIEVKDLKDSAERQATAVRLIDDIRRVPDVKAASLAGWSLFGGMGWTNNIRIPGQPPEPFEPHYLAVSPGFFDTMHIPVLEGRTIEWSDLEGENSSAVVVNDAFARRYFGARPLGRTFGRVDKAMAEQRIVGVVGNAKYRDLRAPAPPTVYVPLRGLGTLHVRTSSNPSELIPTLRHQVHAIHPALRVRDVRLQSTLIENMLLRERLLAVLSAFFAIVGLLLAAVGLYGVLSYSVVQRTHEIGIRLALGAERHAIVRSVLFDAGVMVGAGAVVGLLSGLYLARFVRTLLYEVQPLDGWSVALPLASLLTAAILAAVPPSRRAMRVDPAIALRYE